MLKTVLAKASLSKTQTDILLNLFGYLTPALVAIAVIPQLLDSMGRQYFGLITLTWLVITYFTLFDFGVNRAMIVRIAGISREHKDYIGYTSAALYASVGVGIVFATIILFFESNISNSLAQKNRGLEKEIEFLILLTGAFFPILLLTSYFRSLLESQRMFLYVNIGKVVFLSGVYLLPMVIYWVTENMNYCLASIYFAKALQFGLYFLASLKNKFVSIRQWKLPQTNYLGGIAKFGGWLSLATLLGSMIAYVDRIIVSQHFSLDALADYVIPFEITTKFSILAAAVNVALFPLFSAYAKRYDQVEAYIVLQKKGVKYLLLIGASIVMLFAIGGEVFYKIWLGNNYLEYYYHVSIVLSVGVSFYILKELYIIELQAHGDAKSIASFYAIELPIYFLILIVFARTYELLFAISLCWTIRTIVEVIIFKVLRDRRVARFVSTHSEPRREY